MPLTRVPNKIVVTVIISIRFILIIIDFSIQQIQIRTVSVNYGKNAERKISEEEKDK